VVSSSHIRKDNNEALFVSSKFPYNRLGQRGIEKIFNKLGRDAGITKSVFPHLIRHTTATTMLRSGANLIEVQRLLGHENPSTTEIYADLDDSAVQYSHRKHLI
jgi:integrase/recombinase XerD